MTSEVFGEVISSYTRAQAIEDGTLVDVSGSDLVKELGIKYPVAFTRHVWDECVEIPKGVEGQDLTGRLWDVLYMFRLAVKAGQGGDMLKFSVMVRNDNRSPKRQDLWAFCGPGDQGEPVVTIMYPEDY